MGRNDFSPNNPLRLAMTRRERLVEKMQMAGITLLCLGLFAAFAGGLVVIRRDLVAWAERVDAEGR